MHVYPCPLHLRKALVRRFAISRLCNQALPLIRCVRFARFSEKRPCLFESGLSVCVCFSNPPRVVLLKPARVVELFNKMSKEHWEMRWYEHATAKKALVLDEGACFMS
jgi:hypothetical protein